MCRKGRTCAAPPACIEQELSTAVDAVSSDGPTESASMIRDSLSQASSFDGSFVSEKHTSMAIQYGKLHPIIFSQLPDKAKLEFVAANWFGGLRPQIFAMLPETAQQDIAVAVHRYFYEKPAVESAAKSGEMLVQRRQYAMPHTTRQAELGPIDQLPTSRNLVLSEEERSSLPPGTIRVSLCKDDRNAEGQPGLSPVAYSSEKAYSLWRKNALIDTSEWADQVLASEWRDEEPNPEQPVRTYSMTSYSRGPEAQSSATAPPAKHTAEDDHEIALTGNNLLKRKQAHCERDKLTVAEVVEEYLSGDDGTAKVPPNQGEEGSLRPETPTWSDRVGQTAFSPDFFTAKGSQSTAGSTVPEYPSDTSCTKECALSNPTEQPQQPPAAETSESLRGDENEAAMTLQHDSDQHLANSILPLQEAVQGELQLASLQSAVDCPPQEDREVPHLEHVKNPEPDKKEEQHAPKSTALAKEKPTEIAKHSRQRMQEGKAHRMSC